MRCGRLLRALLVFWGWMVLPALAQQVELSPCANTCIDNALANQTDCHPTDTACICHNIPINIDIRSCVRSKCTVKEGLLAIRVENIRCHTRINNRSTALLTISIVAGAIAAISVCMRMFVAIHQRSIGLDDYACLAAYAASIPVTVVCCITAVHGFGKDTWASPIEEIFFTLKLIYAYLIAYFPATGFTKLCFLFFFLRIFPVRRVERMIHVLIGCTAIYIVVFMTTMIFACKPISAMWTAWTKESTPSYCINQKAFIYAGAGINIALDIAVCLIPIPELWKLNLTTRKKAFLVAIFSVGGITVIISCVRLSALTTYEVSVNPMYNNVLSGVWSVLEVNIGIMCICMPSFSRFLSQVAPSLFTGQSSTIGGGSGRAGPKGSRSSSGGGSPRFPSMRFSFGKKKKNHLDLSFWDATIVKTVDMTVEAVRAEDDQVRLVVLKQGRGQVVRNGRCSRGSTIRGGSGSTSPKDWEKGAGDWENRVETGTEGVFDGRM